MQIQFTMYFHLLPLLNRIEKPITSQIAAITHQCVQLTSGCIPWNAFEGINSVANLGRGKSMFPLAPSTADSYW